MGLTTFFVYTIVKIMMIGFEMGLRWRSSEH